MKKILLSLLIAVYSLGSTLAQTDEGIILYDQKINMHRRLPDESMKAMMPEFHTDKMQLAVRGVESLYKNVEVNDTDEETTDQNGNAMRMVRRVPQNEIYRNFEEKKGVELRELAGQKFLIRDELKQTP